MAVYDILQIVRHVTDTLAESHVYFSFLKVSSTVAELEVMSAKPWDFFLASLCFDQPLEPWPSIGIFTGKNPISKSA